MVMEIGTPGEGKEMIELDAAEMNARVMRMLHKLAEVEDSVGTEETFRIAVANMHAMATFILTVGGPDVVRHFIEALRKSAEESIVRKEQDARATVAAPEGLQ